MNNSGNKNQSQTTKLLSNFEVIQIINNTRKRFNSDKNIDEEINFITKCVQTNFLNDYNCVKNMLMDQMIAQFCYSLTENCNLDEKIKKFNHFLNDAGCFNISSIREKYKKEIQIANKVYEENWNQINLGLSRQPFIQFKYYNQKLKNYESGNKNTYLNQVNFEPKYQDTVFQQYCFQIFSQLYHDPVHGIQILNFQLFNKNTKMALNYANTKFQQMKQRLHQYYSDDATWLQMEKTMLDQLHEQWKDGMNDFEIDKLLNLQQYEQEIQQKIIFNATVKAFIELRSQFGQYYLFDEEYEMINNSAKIKEIISLPKDPTTLAQQFYNEILDQLQPDQQIEETKNALIDQFKNQNIIPMLQNQNKGMGIQLLFNNVRNSVIKEYKNCSFYYLQKLEIEEHKLSVILVEQLMKDSEQIKAIILNKQEQAQILTNIRKLFKTYIINEEEYQQVIYEQDQQFQEIIHPCNELSLDDDQVEYLEKQINEFQKVKFIKWLSKCWNLCRQELSKYQDMDDENELIEQFLQIQSDIVKSISNKIAQLDNNLLLEKQFKQKWIEDKWEERVIEIFTLIYRE